MATISSLFVELKLQADTFNNGIRAAQKEIKEFEKNVKPTLTVVKDLGIGMAAAGGAIVAGMLGATKSAVDYGDALNDARQRTGASVETLAKLGFAAEQSGSSFAGLSTGLKFLAKNMQEAVGGSKAQVAAFASLGVSSSDLAAAHGDVNKVMLLVADQFRNMEDGAAKSALAMELFGRSGVDLIPMLNEGSVGLKKLGDDAVRAGLVMSKETAEASDKLNDTLNELKAAALGASIGIATALLPALQSAASLVTEVMQGFAGLIKEHQGLTQAVAAGGGTLLAMGTALVGIAVIVPKIAAGFTLLQGALASIGITITGATLGIVALGAALGVAVGSLINWAIEGTRVQKWLDSFTTSVVGMVGGWSSTSEAAKSAAFTANAAAAALANTSEAVKTATAVAKPHVLTVKEQEAALERLKEAAQRAKVAAAALKEETARLVTQYMSERVVLQHLQVVETMNVLNLNRMRVATEGLRAAALSKNEAADGLEQILIMASLANGALKGLSQSLKDVLMVPPPVWGPDLKAAADEAKRLADIMAHDLREATEDVKRAAGAVFDAMFIKGQSVFSSLKNLLKGGALSLGRAIFEDIAGALLGPIKKAFDDFFIAVLEGAGLKKLVSGIGERIGGAISGKSPVSAGGRAGGAAGGIGSGGSGAGSSGGALGNLNAVTGVVSAVSSVIGNFQMARLEGTMNAVEANTRFTYIELRDLMNLQMNPIIWFLERIHGSLTSGAGSGGSGLPQTGLATSASQIFANAVEKFAKAVGTSGDASVTIEVHNEFNINGTNLTPMEITEKVIPRISESLQLNSRGMTAQWARSLAAITPGLTSTGVPA